jgi:Uncharacterized protein conserved in bacteria (DUF2147)
LPGPGAGHTRGRFRPGQRGRQLADRAARRHHPDQPGLKDEHNPEAARRGLALRGQVILRDMKYDGAGHWSGGTIYKPDNGKTYRCKVALTAKDMLEVRGFIGFSLFGITQEWTRYTGTSMDLPPAH